MQNGVWAVTTLASRDPMKRRRTPGIFATEAEAKLCVETNLGDIYEFEYDCAVVEFVPFGLYSLGRVQFWYEWHDESYVQRLQVPQALQDWFISQGWSTDRLANWSEIG
jgi:hypothetical protein